MSPEQPVARRFIGEPIEVRLSDDQALEKSPTCPEGFRWRGVEHAVVETLDAWQDFRRRGRSKRNMRPEHVEVAAQRGSWGVGRYYFRVRTSLGAVFELYYDRAPASATDRKGSWYLYRELEPRRGRG